jgi:hypothetical protein
MGGTQAESPFLLFTYITKTKRSLIVHFEKPELARVQKILLQISFHVIIRIIHNRLAAAQIAFLCISDNLTVFVIDQRLSAINVAFLQITISLYLLGNYRRTGTHDMRDYRDADKENCYYCPKDMDIIFHLFKQLSTLRIISNLNNGL